jgi:hypothetical protein
MQCFVQRPDRIHLEDEGMDVSKIFKWIFKKWDEEARKGLLWLRAGTSGGRL